MHRDTSREFSKALSSAFLIKFASVQPKHIHIKAALRVLFSWFHDGNCIFFHMANRTAVSVLLCLPRHKWVPAMPGRVMGW